jgi:acylphosphatase
MQDNKRCRILISGQVQGVRYRAFAKIAAEKNNITGFARNLPDNRVEVVAEGDEFDLLSFIQLLRTGPPSAVVDGFDMEWEEATNEFSRFEVRH